MKFQLAAAALLLGGYPTTNTVVSAQSIADIVVQSPDHTILEEAVLAAPPAILSTLNGTGPYTVFAPTDAAFEELPGPYLDLLLTPAWSSHLVCVLSAHVVPGTYRSTDLPTNVTAVPTLLSGYNVSVVRDGEEASVNGIPVIAADLNATNGVVHVIEDGVISPPCIASSIADIADSLPDFSTLVSLVQAAGLMGTLNGDIGPYTVFAPTNAAFAEIDPSILEALGADDAALEAVLLYHVIDGNAYSSGLNGTANVATLNGGNVTVTAAGGTVTINNATVTAADILAGNGVIHVINKVLLPPDFVDPRGTNVEFVFNSPDHAILLDAVTSAEGLVDTLASLESYTLFAPTDMAFEETVPEETLSMLLTPSWSRHLACVLQEHVIIGPAVLSKDITNGLTAKTVNGDDISFAVTQVENTTSITVENVTISAPDIVTSDGVVHVIDGVILPDCVTQSLYAVASSTSDFSTLKTLVDLAGLNETLSTEMGLTLFAPTNAAFDKLDKALVASLQANVTALTDVLTYHVLNGVRALEGDLLEEGTAETLEGSSLAFLLTATNMSTVNGITIADEVLASNGVIYIIDAVLSKDQTMPPPAPTNATNTTMAPVPAVAPVPTSAPVAAMPSVATTGSPVGKKTGAPTKVVNPPPPTAGAPASAGVVTAARSVAVAAVAVAAATIGLNL